MDDRSRIAGRAADRLATGPMPTALVGFDGFIDSIIDVVDVRRDMSPSGYQRIGSIAAFSKRCSAAAGKSANMEMVVRERRFGGNGPLMAGALGRAGCGVTYIGAVGQEQDETALDPIYAQFAMRCRRVMPVAPPARTDALEFDDGKLMLGYPANVQRVTWARLVELVGLEAITAEVGAAQIIGLVNWTMMGGVEGVWRGLIDEVLPRAAKVLGRRVFVDLADPAKRSDADVARAMGLLREMDGLAPVTLGLNRAEAERVLMVVGGGSAGATRLEDEGSRAAALRERLGLSCVVVHRREGAGAAVRRAGGSMETGWFRGPLVARPKILTGAGDHFNAGFALGLALDMPVPEALAVGCGVAGAYVRDGASPDGARLTSFLRTLPEPERVEG